jgi:hypothetical protein
MLKTQVVGCCFGIPFGCGTLLLTALALALGQWAGWDWLPF